MSQVSVTTHVADRIKTLRDERGWTARELADACARAGTSSLTRSTIAKIESGVRKSITADELVTLSEVLEVSPDALIGSDTTDTNGEDRTIIRVLLVDDLEIVRSGLRHILRRREGFVIVAECDDGADVPAAVEANEIDVIVMDLRMRYIDGVEAIRRLRNSGEHPPVLALTTFDDDELVRGALTAGAAGYVLKDSPADELIRAVRAVAAGGGWLDPAVAPRVITAYRHGYGHADRLNALQRHPDVENAGTSRQTPTAASPRPEPAQASFRISVLGPLRVWQRGTAVDLGPLRQQALLAALVLRPDKTVARQELLDGVWGIEEPSGNVVPVYVYRLRKSLQADDASETVIVRDRGGYRFVSDGTLIDKARSDELVTEANRAEQIGDIETAADLYGRAFAMFQGEPLAGLPGPFANLERQRLAERRIALAQRKSQCDVQLSRYNTAISELMILAGEHPHNEQIAALLIRALHGSGRQADALRAYSETRKRLHEDLGLEPGPELREARQNVMLGQAPPITSE